MQFLKNVQLRKYPLEAARPFHDARWPRPEYGRNEVIENQNLSVRGAPDPHTIRMVQLYMLLLAVIEPFIYWCMCMCVYTVPI